jgi:hypothetical protein
MAAYPDPPPVIPVPESLAAQGPYVRLSCPGLARARNVSRHWAPPRACYRVPCCEEGDPSSPKEVQGGLSGSPRIRAGTSRRQRSHARHPPLGQPQLNVPRKKSHPRGKPLQPRFPKEHHRRRAADDSLCSTRPQSKHRLQPGNGEGRRGRGGGLGRHISAAARLRMHSNIFSNTDSNPRLTAYLSYSEPTHHRSESLGTAVAVGGHLPKRVVY